MKKYIAKEVELAIVDLSFVPSRGQYAITISDSDVAKLTKHHPTLARLVSRNGNTGILFVGREWLQNLAASNLMSEPQMFNLLKATDCAVALNIEERIKGGKMFNSDGSPVLDANGTQRKYDGLKGFPEDKPYAVYSDVVGILGDKARIAMYQTSTEVEVKLQLEKLRNVETFVPRSRRSTVATATVKADPTAHAEFRSQRPDESDAEYAEEKIAAGFTV